MRVVWLQRVGMVSVDRSACVIYTDFWFDLDKTDLLRMCFDSG